MIDIDSLASKNASTLFAHLNTFFVVSITHLLGFVGAYAANPENAHVSIRVLGDAGELTPARAWINVDGKRFFEPTHPNTVTSYAKDRSFSCDGAFTMMVPPGLATVHVEKGKEYLPVDLVLPIESGTSVEHDVILKRWIDMPSKGWFSADLHIHLGHDDLRVLQQLALADDVHLMPSFTYWLRGEGERWKPAWPDESYQTPITIDPYHIISRNNLEIERIQSKSVPGGSIGATFLFNLNRPVSAARYGAFFPTDATLCRVAQSHSPNVVLDSDKPSWAETVIGAALGTLDTIQVCHNHYHRTSTLPGGWGMIGPLSSNESNAAVGDGLFHRTNSLYYRLLNCGFQLGVSGGSAIGVMPVPAGFNRVYAKIDGEFTAGKMWDSIKAGRSFATTGPILTMQADGQGMGATISRTTSEIQPISITASVRSIDLLEALQIVHNGRVVASFDLRHQMPAPAIKQDLLHELRPKQSGWFAARALYKAPDGLLRQAHTSPIYVSIDGKPTAFENDARYMLRWIDTLSVIAQLQLDRFPDLDSREQVLKTYREARTKVEQVIMEAQRH